MRTYLKQSLLRKKKKNIINTNNINNINNNNNLNIEEEINFNEEEINNNEINIGNEWEEQHKEILQNIKNKEQIFNEQNPVDDNNEGNNVGCCCFVSRERFNKVQETSKKYFNENQKFKDSGKDIITFFALQTLKIKKKIKELQGKIKDDEVNYKNLKEKTKKLKDENDILNKEMFEAITGKLEVDNENLKQKIELLTRQTLDNNIINQNVGNKKEIDTKIKELKKY